MPGQSDAPYKMPAPSFDKPVRLLIVVAHSAKDITDALEAGARDAAIGCGAEVEVAQVPSIAEVPTAIAMAERLQKFDAYVALGCLDFSETKAAEIIFADASRAISMLGLGGACIGNGILLVESRAQAGADDAGQNKGRAAALAALHLVALSRKWARSTTGIGFRA